MTVVFDVGPITMQLQQCQSCLSRIFRACCLINNGNSLNGLNSDDGKWVPHLELWQKMVVEKAPWCWFGFRLASRIRIHHSKAVDEVWGELWWWVIMYMGCAKVFSWEKSLKKDNNRLGATVMRYLSFTVKLWEKLAYLMETVYTQVGARCVCRRVCVNDYIIWCGEHLGSLSF